MKLIQKVDNVDFLIFVLGVYGPKIGAYVHKLIASCNTDMFGFIFVVVMYVIISSKHNMKLRKSL